MRIEEFSKIIDKPLVIRFVPRRNPDWFAYFDQGDIKGDGVLIGESGNGNTPLQALSDYAKTIRGKTLVFGAGTNKRIEFRVPEDLE